MNARALVVAYYFPPMGGAGTQRFAKFCRYLPEHGFDPVVVCSGSAADRSAPHADDSFRDELPPNDVVFRVPEPRRTAFERARDVLRVSLDGEAWARAAIPVAIDAAMKHGAGVVVTTVAPFGAYRVGLEVRKRLGIPWIIDLRDPWALDGWRRYASPLHAANDLRRMRRALIAADAVIANTTESALAYAELGVDSRRIAVIPNGFDPADFGAEDVACAHDSTLVRIVHVGTFHSAVVSSRFEDERLPKWSNRALRYECRSGRYLILAAAALRARRPDLARRLRLDLYGEVHPSNLSLAEEHGVRDMVVAHGYVPHAAAIRALRQADVVFVPLHDVAAGERALVVPGKIYEALASGPWVLAAVPEGDAADLVRATGRGVVCKPAAVDEIAAALVRLCEAGPCGPWQGSQLELFTRRRLTASLASVMRSVVARTDLAVADPFGPLRESLAR